MYFSPFVFSLFYITCPPTLRSIHTQIIDSLYSVNLGASVSMPADVAARDTQYPSSLSSVPMVDLYLENSKTNTSSSPSMVEQIGPRGTLVMLILPIPIQIIKRTRRKAAIENLECPFVGFFLVYRIITYMLIIKIWHLLRCFFWPVSSTTLECIFPKFRGVTGNFPEITGFCLNNSLASDSTPGN